APARHHGVSDRRSQDGLSDAKPILLGNARGWVSPRSTHPTGFGYRFWPGVEMTNWSETYRGTVPPWECDVTEHFTIAYYFDRLEEAEPNLADALGLGERLRGGGFARRLDVRFARALRAGSSFQVESAVIAIDDVLR